jgi:hypothetical protein
MRLFQKLKSIKFFRLILTAIILIFAGKILDHFHFQNLALTINLVAFFLVLYSLIYAIESRGKN